ncbi:hypothetical protein [Pseudoalteromonas sp. Xi13]|uniref:hypothetical protein n=1 Tax=Pseudoalteromonas sp. Xi13 TaxID=2490635 RepID=UPI000F74D696|nr:hypothetical protein [Pseudoalteromonas sp. Xi13]AZN32557.1 hypothetical protein EJ103_07420 [Pseudoalteromonas sp. Xi13]
MKNPILYTTRGCKFCPDVKSYAELAGLELDIVRLSESNPHGLRSAPAIEHNGEIYIGIDDCAAFIRRFAKEAA